MKDSERNSARFDQSHAGSVPGWLNEEPFHRPPEASQACQKQAGANPLPGRDQAEASETVASRQITGTSLKPARQASIHFR